MCCKGVFLPGALRPGPYGSPTVGRQELRIGLSSAVNWRVGGPICLAGTIGLLSLFVRSVAVGGTGVENDREGVELAAQARYER